MGRFTSPGPGLELCRPESRTTDGLGEDLWTCSADHCTSSSVPPETTGQYIKRRYSLLAACPSNLKQLAQLFPVHSSGFSGHVTYNRYTLQQRFTFKSKNLENNAYIIF